MVKVVFVNKRPRRSLRIGQQQFGPFWTENTNDTTESSNQLEMSSIRQKHTNIMEIGLVQFRPNVQDIQLEIEKLRLISDKTIDDWWNINKYQMMEHWCGGL